MKVVGLFRLVRFPNLLMVALTMYLMRWSVIKPILMVQNLDLQVSELAFLVLVLSTVLITAAGYVINDYHDVKADRFNQPGRVVIDCFVSRRQAMVLHWALNSVGVIAGSVYSIVYGLPWMIVLFSGVPVLLWYYSIRLKHIVLFGNLAISLLTATVPLLVLFFEFPLLARNYGDELPFIHNLLITLSFWVGMFSFFAFSTNLIREIIKDAEDMRGDQESGSKTLPLVFGLKRTRLIAMALSSMTLAILGFVFVRYLTDWISLGFFMVFLFVPFLVLIIKLVHSKSQDDFHNLSQLVKLIMLFGLLYAPVAQWLIGKMFKL